MKAPSLRWRLLIRCGVGVGALLGLLSAAIYLVVSNGMFRELDNSIAQTAAMLANQVELEDESITFEWQEGLGTNRALIADGLFQFWEEKTGATTRSPALGMEDLPKFSGLQGKPVLRGFRLPDGSRGRAIGLRIHPFALPEEVAKMKARGRFIDPRTLPFILVVADDAEPVHRTLERLRWILASGSLLTLGLGFILIDQVIRISLKPIDDLSSQVQDRAEHRLDSALDLPDALPAELTGLARNFDTLLARVAAIRERERDFIRHAAHELRTPIAGLRATTDLALSQQRDAAAYAGHLATCQSSAVELGELVTRLSALSRVGQTVFPQQQKPVDLGIALTECCETFQGRCKERQLSIRHELPAAPLVIRGDATLLRIVLNNLLDNATSYAPCSSEILVRGQISGGRVEMRIANRAEDLPDNLERLFEPLFRKESSRSDSSIHLGIGLTLSLEAATAMASTLRAHRPASGSIELILSIPQWADG